MGKPGRASGGGPAVDDYIVRIYRWGGRRPQRLVGVVEEVGVEGKTAFHSLDELWRILTLSKERRRGGGRGTAGNDRITGEGEP